METKSKKDFDAVKYMREQRKSLSEKLIQMTKSEVVEYFRNKQLKYRIKPSA